MVNPLPDNLQRAGVLGPGKILEAFGAIDRADFVPKELILSAYADEALPIGGGQTISQPYTVAFMLNLLDPKEGEKIMEVGAGSGWQTSILAYVVGLYGENQKPNLKNQNSGKVYAIERMPELCEFGKENISKYNFLENGVVEWFCQNAFAGLPEHAPFDKIIAAASIVDDEVPKAWKEQLMVGGKMVVPIGNSIWLFTKQPNGTFHEREFPGFVFVPLVKDN